MARETLEAAQERTLNAAHPELRPLLEKLTQDLASLTSKMASDPSRRTCSAEEKGVAAQLRRLRFGQFAHVEWADGYPYSNLPIKLAFKAVIDADRALGNWSAQLARMACAPATVRQNTENGAAQEAVRDQKKGAYGVEEDFGLQYEKLLQATGPRALSTLLGDVTCSRKRH